MKTFFLLMACCLLVNCAAKPLHLSDQDVIPTGSRLEFWVYHDEHQWQKSNVYVAMLPRPMTGLEARQWAESTGKRDGGLRWTHYYVVATPEVPRRQYRSRVYSVRSEPYELAGRIR